MFNLSYGIVFAALCILAACGSDSSGGSTPASPSTPSGANTGNGQQPASGTPTNPSPTEPAGTRHNSDAHHFVTWLDGVPTTFRAGDVANLTLTVWNTNTSPATGLRFTTTFTHKMMGHGSSMLPYVEEVGHGIYTVKNVMGSMRGTWSLSLDCSNATLSDSVAYDIEVQ